MFSPTIQSQGRQVVVEPEVVLEVVAGVPVVAVVVAVLGAEALVEVVVEVVGRGRGPTGTAGGPGTTPAKWPKYVPFVAKTWSLQIALS